mmetsp:Transcript_9669/g.21687  ORF Transcript_9669/g.21687 Transcript_9669/m.21687 type:complete len:246 (-) Transcript_9669:194-931(-)
MGGCSSNTCNGSGSKCTQACTSEFTGECRNPFAENTDEQYINANFNLLRASAEGDADRIRHAISWGADVNTRTRVVLYPLKTWDESREQADKAAAEQAWEGSDVLRDTGLTPLMHAAMNGQTTAVALLLMARAMPSLQEEDGMQALHFAASAACQECCRSLLLARARPSQQDDSGRDAFACLPEEATESKQERKAWTELLRPSDSDTAAGEGHVDRDAVLMALAAAAQVASHPETEELWDPLVSR